MLGCASGASVLKAGLAVAFVVDAPGCGGSVVVVEMRKAVGG